MNENLRGVSGLISGLKILKPSIFWYKFNWNAENMFYFGITPDSF